VIVTTLTRRLRSTRCITATAAIAALVAACGSNATQPSTSASSAAAAPVKVALAAEPSGTATLTWDPQSKNVTAKLQMLGFTPGSSHAMHIHQGSCAAIGDVVVPFPDVTADGGGAINTTVAGLRPAPDGLTGGTALNIHLASGAQLGGPGALGYTQIACGDITGGGPTATLTMALPGQQPQGSASLAYDPAKKTLTVTTTASGLAPGSSHAQHIHLGSCDAQGAVKYPLDDLVAAPTGSAQATTVVQNADAPPASGWYLNVHMGSSGQILQNGQPTLYFQPIICGNVGK
jgi:hypothetical protein